MVKRTKGTIEVFLQLDDLGEDVPAEVTYTYTPSTPDVMYDKNGDPGWPGDPEEIELLELFVKPWGLKIPVEFLHKSAHEYICEKISEQERD